MACCTVKLAKEFNRLASNAPELAAEMKPFGIGANAIVLREAETDFLTKIVFRPKNHKWRTLAKEWFETEVSALGAFTQSPLKTVVTPLLIGAPKVIDHGRYYAMFRMTRLHGKEVCHTARTPHEQSMFEHMHRSAGRLLARFHDEVVGKQLNIPETNKRYCCDLKTSNALSDRINRALEDAYGYVRANAIPAVIHNDFHKGNILFDGNGDASGLIDFSAMCHSPNKYHDFMCVSEDYLPAFIAGYEEESGERVDRCLLDATRLTHGASFIDRAVDDPQEFTNTVMFINEHLNRLVDITGMKP